VQRARRGTERSSERGAEIIVLERARHALDLAFAQAVTRGALTPARDHGGYLLRDRARLGRLGDAERGRDLLRLRPSFSGLVAWREAIGARAETTTASLDLRGSVSK